MLETDKRTGWVTSAKFAENFRILPDMTPGDLASAIEEIHVLPAGERHEREATCPCRPCPIVLDEYGRDLPYAIVVHNAFDGREHLEEPVTFKP
jgi:hypothetical protein